MKTEDELRELLAESYKDLESLKMSQMGSEDAILCMCERISTLNEILE